MLGLHWTLNVSFLRAVPILRSSTLCVRFCETKFRRNWNQRTPHGIIRTRDAFHPTAQDVASSMTHANVDNRVSSPTKAHCQMMHSGLAGVAQQLPLRVCSMLR